MVSRGNRRDVPASRAARKRARKLRSTCLSGISVPAARTNHRWEGKHRTEAARAPPCFTFVARLLGDAAIKQNRRSARFMADMHQLAFITRNATGAVCSAGLLSKDQKKGGDDCGCRSCPCILNACFHWKHSSGRVSKRPTSHQNRYRPRQSCVSEVSTWKLLGFWSTVSIGNQSQHPGFQGANITPKSLKASPALRFRGFHVETFRIFPRSFQWKLLW